MNIQVINMDSEIEIEDPGGQESSKRDPKHKGKGRLKDFKKKPVGGGFVPSESLIEAEGLPYKGRSSVSLGSHEIYDSNPATAAGQPHGSSYEIYEPTPPME